MRKAMQAEQSKAEKLNKLASLHQICEEQDDLIEQLKDEIRELLATEQEQKVQRQ